MRMTTNDIAVVLLTILSAITLLLVFVFNGLASVGGNSIFETSVVNISDTYSVDITPAGYTFAIWGIIYAWLAAWTVYALINIFRKNVHGRVLLNPVVLTIPCQLFWILSSVANIVWLYVWCQAELFVAFIMISIYCITGYFAMGFLTDAIVDNEVEIYKNSKYDYWLNYILYQNGMGCLYSWTTIATLVNLSVFLAYDPIVSPNMSVQDASLVSSAILLSAVVIWSALENTVLYKYVRYLYVWYFVVVWAAIGVLVGNYDVNNPNTVLTLLTLCIAVVCFVIKIVNHKHRSRPRVSADLGDMEFKASPL